MDIYFKQKDRNSFKSVAMKGSFQPLIVMVKVNIFIPRCPRINQNKRFLFEHQNILAEKNIYLPDDRKNFKLSINSCFMYPDYNLYIYIYICICVCVCARVCV